MSEETNGSFTVVSWNINGIRSIKDSLKDVLDALQADVICIQETKTTRDQIDENTAIVPGYNAFFSFSLKRSGYSGVATYCRKRSTPFAAEQGLSNVLQKREENSHPVGCYGNVSDFSHDELISLDSEGRALITHHIIRNENEKEKHLAVINVYCPRADSENEERKLFKLRFYKLLQVRAEALLKNNSHVVIVGDINTSHKMIDHCDPELIEEFDLNPGRQWLDQLLEPIHSDETIVKVNNTEKSSDSHCPNDHNQTECRQFVDTFRYFYPQKTQAFTCWQTQTSARLTNYGTRLDYIIADVELTKNFIRDSCILSDVEGSDHCPVKAVMCCCSVESNLCPSICSKNWPEFSGKQQKLSVYFSKGTVKEDPNPGKYQIPSGKRSQCNDDGNNDGNKRPKLNFKESSQKSNNKSILNFFSSTTNQKAVTKTNLKSNESPAKSKKTEDPETIYKSLNSINTWKSILSGPPVAPMCQGHNEPCVLQTVKKQGANYKRQFYVCARPIGHATNSNARCKFFQWATPPKINTLK